MRINRDKSGRGSVVFERTQIVFESERPINFPVAKRFDDGTIWLNHHQGRHGSPDERQHYLWSRDNGRTWQVPAQPLEPRAVVLRDGSVLAIAEWPANELYHAEPGAYQSDRDPPAQRAFTFRLFRHKSPQSPPEAFETRIEFPFEINPGFYPHELLSNRDGSLLVIGYGNRNGERYRSYVLKSTDEGKTWSYLSTIAHDGAGEVRGGREGPCEPGTDHTADGSLLCLMRTGESMWQSRSRDGGATWQTLPALAQYNTACPRLFMMSTGALVAGFGSYRRRPADNPRIMFLVDYTGTGERWDAECIVYKGYSSGYISMIETEPGLLTLFYDESDFNDDNGWGWYPLNRIMAAHIRIAKSAP